MSHLSRMNNTHHTSVMTKQIMVDGAHTKSYGGNYTVHKYYLSGPPYIFNLKQIQFNIIDTISGTTLNTALLNVICTFHIFSNINCKVIANSNYEIYTSNRLEVLWKTNTLKVKEYNMKCMATTIFDVHV